MYIFSLKFGSSINYVTRSTTLQNTSTFLVGKYCGYTKPRPLVSLTNHLTVFFDTNDRKTDQGFKAHYKAVSPGLTSGKIISRNPFQ